MILRTAFILAFGGIATAEDISWLSNYNVVYQACFHSEQSVAYRLCPRYDNYGNKGNKNKNENANQNQNNNNNNNDASNSKNRSSRNSCAVDCDNGAEYLASVVDFVDAFTEAQMEARAYRCEEARENCEFDDDDLCYDSQELQYCQEDWGEALGVQEWLECQEIKGADNGGDEQQQQDDAKYYVGPYCGDDNFGIHLGVFTDEDCTTRAEDNSAFYDANGYDLPYNEESGDSLIGTQVGNNVEENSQCASCKEHALNEDKNEDDKEDEDDVLEQCEDLYGFTYTKCEGDLEVDVADADTDENDCAYIKTLKDAEHITAKTISVHGGSRGKVRGWLVFLLVALAVGAAVSMYVKHQRKRRNKVGGEPSTNDEPMAQNGPSDEKLIK